MSWPDTNSKILEAIKNPQAPEWADFFRAYWEPLVKIARFAGLSSVDSEEVAQATMVKLAVRMGNFVRNRDHKFRSYVGTALRNTLRDYFQKRGRVPPHTRWNDPEVYDPDLAEALEAEFESALVKTWIDELRQELQKDEEQKTFAIFVHYFVQRVPAKKIAAMFGIEHDEAARRAWSIVYKLRKRAEEHQRQRDQQ